MWNKHKRKKERNMLPEKVSKPLKAWLLER